MILNNDNGNSRDEGLAFTYAGAGGRRRGQNRTAQQSFGQSWIWRPTHRCESSVPMESQCVLPVAQSSQDLSVRRATRMVAADTAGCTSDEEKRTW